MTQQQIDQLRARITKDFGEKCAEYNHWCACCTAHMAVDLLEDLYLVENLGEHIQEAKTSSCLEFSGNPGELRT